MAGLVVAHLLDDCAAFRVARRKAVDMRREVLLDLALGFDDEAKIAAIASESGRDPDGERARVPERIEQRRPVVHLGEPSLRPRKVVLFLARRAIEARPDLGIARHQRLCRIERLCAHLAGMVDAHQSGRMPALVRLERRIGEVGAGNRTGGRGRAGQRAKRAIETEDQ
jgi:hypothetical protein